MPPIVIGIGILLAVGPAITAGIITSVAVANLVLGIGASLVLNGIGGLLTKHPSANPASVVDKGSSQVSSRQAIAPRITQYGRDRRGGVITFIHLNGFDDKYLQLVITLTGHEVQSIDNMYFDGTLVAVDGSGDGTGKYSGTVDGSGIAFVHWEKKLGAAGEAAFPGLLDATLGAPTKWDAAHTQDGCASCYVRLKWSADLFPNGVPAITFDIKGKKVFDPRTGTTAYSENPALCVRDYLMATAANAAAATDSLGLGESDNAVANLLLWSEAFDNAVWIPFGAVAATVNPNVVTDPNGLLDADELVLGATGVGQECGIEQNSGIVPVNGSVYTFSVWLRANTPTSVIIRMVQVTGQNDTTLSVNVTAAWQRFSLTVTMASVGTGAILVRIQDLASTSSRTVNPWGAQLELGSTATPYVQTTILSALAPSINEDMVIAAANVCDEAVSLRAGGTEPRYTINGSFSVDGRPADILQAMLSAMGGTLVYSGGMWKMYAAAWRPPTLPDLTDNDLRSTITFTPLVSRRDLCNAVKGIYRGPITGWQPSDFPVVQNGAYIAQDGGEVIFKDLDLPFTITPSTCQRLAKILLERTRRQGDVRFPGRLTAYQAEVGDIVTVTRSRFGWSSKTFEVYNSQLIIEEQESGPAIGCDLALRETDANVYAWTPATDEVIVPVQATTRLPDNTSVGAPTSLVVVTDHITRVDGVKITRAHISWTSPADQFVLNGGWIVIYRADEANGTTPNQVWEFVTRVAGAATFAYDHNVLNGHVYDFQIFAEHTVGGSFSSPLEADGWTCNDGTSQIFSPSFGGQGSIRPTVVPTWTVAQNTNNGSGACTVRLTCASTPIPLTDGTSLTWPATDVTWVGTLAATTTYLFAPRLKLSNLSVHWATGTAVNTDADPSTVPLTTGATNDQKNQLTINQQFDGYIAGSFGFINVTTPNNGGTGGGSSGGDPTCIHEDVKIMLSGLGLVKASQAEIGDYIRGKDLKSGAYVYRKIVSKLREYCTDWYMIEGLLFTPCEPIHISGKWIDAHDVPGAQQVIGLPGFKISLGVEAEDFDGHNFIVIADDGTEYVVHNPIIPRS